MAVYGSRHTMSRKNSVLTLDEKTSWPRNVCEALHFRQSTEEIGTLNEDATQESPRLVRGGDLLILFPRYLMPAF